MKWDQLEVALTFLENEDDQIVIQVPYVLDFGRIYDYLIINHPLLHPRYYDHRIITKQGTIMLEATSQGNGGTEYDTAHFLVERADGDDGCGIVNNIEYTDLTVC